MSSIGGFREEEIDGKPFLLFNFLPQTDIRTSPSSSDDLSLQPLFLCPSTRCLLENFKRMGNGKASSYEEDDALIVNTSPHFSNIRSCDQQFQHFFDPEANYGNCMLPLAPLFWCSNQNDDHSDDYCKARACSPTNPVGNSYYICVTCDEMFHKECVEAPLEIKHPFYPSLSLQLYKFPLRCKYLWSCMACDSEFFDIFYHCPISNFKMHPFCAMQPIPIFIDHLKRHPHSLTFFPKQNFLPCNVCGVIKDLIPTYVCARCVFVVHQDCIDFPYVIRISRHQHRISFTYSLPSGEWSCGVCRKKVDDGYGAYSCIKCADYFVHSRCALRRDLWDGEELEGVPEEPEIVVPPFERIADGVILHFSHGHHLKLEISRIYDDQKFFQACMLPIFEGSYYSCMDHCDFILHEACADSPLRKHHPLNAHPLELKVVTTEFKNQFAGTFRCDACLRQSCGFVYENFVNGGSCRLDVRCASISEPFKYGGHAHPLFLALTREEERLAICQMCQGTGRTACRKLNCIECDYVICFRCATLPYKAMYKHDNHVLTLRDGKEAGHDEFSWCESCEKKIVYSRKGGFYSCDDYCGTTLHVDCLLGENPYMKPGHTLRIHSDQVHILRNNTMSRPFCYGRRVTSKCQVNRCHTMKFSKSKTRHFVLSIVLLHRLSPISSFDLLLTFCNYFVLLNAL